jgi:Sec-independent protein secretion pathway component TatC
MPLMEHLRELRNRIVMAAHHPRHDSRVRFLPPIWAVVTHPLCSAVISGHTGCKTQGGQLVVTVVFDPFMVQVQVAFLTGLIATSPVCGSTSSLGVHRPGPVRP